MKRQPPISTLSPCMPLSETNNLTKSVDHFYFLVHKLPGRKHNKIVLKLNPWESPQYEPNWRTISDIAINLHSLWLDWTVTALVTVLLSSLAIGTVQSQCGGWIMSKSNPTHALITYKPSHIRNTTCTYLYDKYNNNLLISRADS